MDCTYIKDNGEKCQAKAIKGSELCFSHNPDMEGEKLLAVSKGGMATKRVHLDLTPVEVRNPQDVRYLLEDTINRVRTGEMPVNIGNSIGYLTGHVLKAIEVYELQGKLEELEGVIKGRNI